MDTKKIKKLVQDNRPEFRAQGFPKHVQAKVTAAAKVMLASGRTHAAVAKAFGVSESTVDRWTKNGHNGKSLPNDAIERLAVQIIPAVALPPDFYTLVQYEIQGVILGVKTKEEAYDRIFALVEDGK